MPFSLPFAIGAGIIRLTVEDGKKDFKERWKTLFAAKKILNSNKTDGIKETPNSNETDDIEETSNSN
ncbi:396_t:CDS:2 [Diversispora eburnea]|uniref:396_t:CDS:1 n=1 Tax=Diversispora eburnea TaxID=1213867 RepID=A0A9N9AC97_9GLOM|nr:396_t:CDS:2 [Diversispora eburnea]